MNERGLFGIGLAVAALAMSAHETPVQRAEREARQAAARRRREAEEAAQHPATKSKPKSATLERLLRRRRK